MEIRGFPSSGFGESRGSNCTRNARLEEPRCFRVKNACSRSGPGLGSDPVGRGGRGSRTLRIEVPKSSEAVHGGNSAPQIHVHPEPQNVTLSLNRIFTDVFSSDGVILD